MIKLPTIKQLHLLAAFQGAGCVTIYVPFVAANAATNPMQIVLKGAVKDAQAQLEAAGVPEKTIRKTLRPARLLSADASAFWPHHQESLALFLHPDLSRHYRLPAQTTALSIRVGQGFDLEPIADILAGNRHFAVLVLDRHATQLYVGDQFHLTPTLLQGFPADMEQTLRIDEFPSARELHGLAPAYTGKGSEGYHSQYNVAEVNKQLLTKFFRTIDHRLHRYLTDRRLPLIIAGVGYLLPLYRAVNTYKQLVPGGLRGSFRRTRLDILHGQAWAALSVV